LQQVECKGAIIYDGQTETIQQMAADSEDNGESFVKPGSALRINFLTPTRIVSNEKLVAAPDFQGIFRTLLRRISMLAYFHCGKELEVDYKGLIEHAAAVETVDRQTRWHDWERYSARQDERMKFGGFVGQLGFTGDFETFHPWLKAGELVHVGKGTAFGLGRYEMMREEGA
jgi:CRISPR/Cas system endoribonuclease Cas6 (RAMP superfamily)